MNKLLLGSNSPRRKELLQSLGYNFEVVKIECDEIYPEKMETSKIVNFLSELKANAFRPLEKDEILITADTIVVLENEVLGKPKNHIDAKKMLQKLSGKTHQVYTGICIKTPNEIFSCTDCADVSFANLDESEIEFYINTYKPFDKAGSYGIQEWLGMSKILKIEGSFYTIMGLPTHLVYEKLKQLI